MRTYRVSFSVAIHDKTITYPEVKPVDISISETLPKNVDPHQYVRRRIAEELTRAFSTADKIDNMEEGQSAPATDPLA